ncbi:MAG: alpha-amylase [Sphingobacteriia bacterium]|nr:MAG: alpha-amylase [Sphingobacteriia bacterium]
MYQYTLHQQINKACEYHQLDIAGIDQFFYTRFIANALTLQKLYIEIYGDHPAAVAKFSILIETIIAANKNRKDAHKARDREKEKQGTWFTSNQMVGMSLYVDRFCNTILELPNRIDYLKKLGVNFLHLMPLFESPSGESDGGYAVSNFRKIDARFGALADLQHVQTIFQENNIYLMIDMVLNHTSHQHEWARKAKAGEKIYQDFYYLYNDRSIPDEFDKTMPEIFPESAPGNFTYIPQCNKWAMTVFHQYQWDLNFTNPAVFIAMLENILFYANLGVDILRIDAPAFIWKQLGTSCQNLPKAHTLLRLIKQCVHIATPGMALLGEAIVAPKEIMKYFGTDEFVAKECDVAYNATQMALQWDALATGDTRVMLAAQHHLMQKPLGTTWINYTRCHDDIGLGYDNSMIEAAGYNPYEHRKFLKDYYSGNHSMSTASGALFSVNPKTQDARISGTLASLCGLEKALLLNDITGIDQSIAKIILMQAQSFFLGGIPMLFYGDELGYTNDYSYQNDEGKSYDNRWMHRPLMDWDKNKLIETKNSIESRIFSATKRLIQIRKKLSILSDQKNIRWLTPHNIHIAGFVRTAGKDKLYCLFNFSKKAAYITWYAFKEAGCFPTELYDYWTEQKYKVGSDHEYLVIEPYQFYILEPNK